MSPIFARENRDQVFTLLRNDLEGNEVCLLGEGIDNDPDLSATVRCGQLSDEVHGNVSPW